jgi:hypothetical protein
MLLRLPAGRPDNWSSIPTLDSYLFFLITVQISFGFYKVLYLMGTAVHCPAVMGKESDADRSPLVELHLLSHIRDHNIVLN